MLTVNQLPIHLQGELYRNVLDNFSEEEEIFVGRPIKTDFIFETHADIIEMIDTCMFLAVDLPTELFHHVAQNTTVLTQIRQYEAEVNSGLIQESFFMTTAEYHALKVLAEFDTSMDYNISEHAIKNESIILLQYIVKNMEFDPHIIHFAVECGHIPIIAYLVEVPSIILFLEQKNTLCKEATKLPVLKYLRETLQFPWDKDVVLNAIQYHKHHDCLQYALENGCPVHVEGFYRPAPRLALRNPKTDALRLLVELRGYKPTERDMRLVASIGALHHLIYLHGVNTPWHEHSVNRAARFKHHACVDYGIQCGAPYDPNIVELSRLPYRSDIDQWMASMINGT